jgi:hypothetical protein
MPLACPYGANPCAKQFEQKETKETKNRIRQNRDLIAKALASF